jgi:hypothetical protein
MTIIDDQTLEDDDKKKNIEKEKEKIQEAQKKHMKKFEVNLKKNNKRGRDFLENENEILKIKNSSNNSDVKRVKKVISKDFLEDEDDDDSYDDSD